MPISLGLTGSALLFASVAAGHPEACGPTQWGVCLRVVEAYRRGPSGERGVDKEEARRAISTLEGGCDSGQAAPCLFLADLAARGVDGIMSPDRARARSWTERACSLGVPRACETLRVLDASPLSAEDVLGVRLSITRRRMGEWPRSTGADRERPLCVAFASDADPIGVDPPAPFFRELEDLPVVKPLSWCLEREQGDVLALGPIHIDAGWPPRPAVETWSILMVWDGRIVPFPETLVREGATWRPDRSGRATIQPPRVSNDRADDRRRITHELTEYARAWNEGQPSGLRDEGSACELRMREDTRLEADSAVFEFNESGPWATYAHASLRLVGTFQPGSRHPWPLEPWKQEGAVTSVGIALQRSDGWWRSGHWTIMWTDTPWRCSRVDK